MKRRIVLGFALAVLLLLALVTVVGSRDVIDHLQRADGRILVLGFCSGALALAFRAVVWVRFLSVIDDSFSRRRIVAVFLTAMFVKYVTPYGQLAAEPFVAYLVSQGKDIAFEDGLAGILSADLFNYIPYYTFGFLALGLILLRGTLGGGLVTQLFGFGALFLVLVSLVFVAVRRPTVVYSAVLAVTSAVRGLVGRFTTRFQDQLAPDAVRSRLDSFYASIDRISADRPTLVVAIVAAHLGTAFLMLPIYLGAVALGYQLTLPVVALVAALGKLGSVVPAPGGTGGVEAMITAGLTALGGLEPAAALTVALIYRVCTYWLTIGVGGIAAADVLLRQS